MVRRILIVVFAGALMFTAACSNKKAVNPLAGVESKQPDKVLFDKAMDAMKRNRFDVARMTLQTLINTYPDSEYIARAKLAVGDSWYAEGGTASLAQAEQEYRDFITFFPNMPEAAEAQLKIANIQYQQMEQPDRDYTHAKRAEEEYRNLIMQFPDSKLVPEAKQRLLEVQEVLAQREFDIGRFYYLRESYPASIARLQTLVDQYPLYSHADEALFLLGQDYEGLITRIRAVPTCDAHGQPHGCTIEAAKARMIAEFTRNASAAYDRILTRYPIMDRSDDAKKRLADLHQPVPRPTRAAVAQNRAEDESRKDAGGFGRMTEMFMKHPDVGEATKIGEPTLVDPTPVNARDLNQQTMRVALGVDNGNKNSLAVETVKPGDTPGPNDAAPRSDTASANTNSSPQSSTPDPNELTPNVGRSGPTGTTTAKGNDPNELVPNADASQGDAPLPPPPQVNEIQPGEQQTPSATAANSSSSSALASDQDISSSKKKKKKGFKKYVPF